MSGNGFEVEPQTMRDAGATVSDLAGRFLDELDGFEAQMTGYGEPWGADDIGSLIGVAYTEVAAYVFDCLGLAAEEIGSAGGDLSSMADAYDRVDEDGAGTMRSLAGGLG
ncbi:hypothetical protein GA0070607_5375 [Micromonospora coriariae]|uniref:Excreted virulence factor EspC, type VII ESX diderm n=1 Tax=Micromonospora coriariae TaxID=285665 RepID=A0A1C4XKW3_9ACTN|nr:hypothetical protein [Micromonospora coriariae]SCF08801.1 hypothetical protein GA0070607_5375 [Micromonospora coriariae]